MVRAVGVEPTRGKIPGGFSCRLRLSPPGRSASRAIASGLRSGLSLHRPPEDPGLRCCPSSLYTFPVGFFRRAWLGIAITGFPEFEQFCIAGFPASTQVLPLSPQRLPFRHARMGGYRYLSYKQPNGIYTSVCGGDGRGRFCVLVCVPGWFLVICFGFGLMMLIAAASRLVLMWAA